MTTHSVSAPGARVAAIAAALVAVFAAAPARAQSRSFSIQRFQLSLDRNGLLGVSSAVVPPQLSWDAAAWLDATDDSLVAYANQSGGQRVGAIVSHRIGLTVGGALVLLPRFEAGVELPVVLSQGQAHISGYMSGGLSAAAIGDIGLVTKLHILDASRYGFDLAFAPSFTLPTATTSDFIGEASTTFSPEVDASQVRGPIRLAANLGFTFRQDSQFANLHVTDEVYLRLGGAYDFTPRFGFPIAAYAEASLATAASSPFSDANQTYFELLAGGSYRVRPGLSAVAAVGAGLGRGFGSPDVRGVAGVRLSSRLFTGKAKSGPVRTLDSDGDGLLDIEDKCPHQPEDVDGYQDADGCPDPDNDKDGIVDAKDKCPDKAEDKDGFQDADGCPDPDNDGDGVPDAKDLCASEPGPAVTHGCPVAKPLAAAKPKPKKKLPDRDGDGVPDKYDNCPDQAGSVKNHGCTAPQTVVVTDTGIEIRQAVFFVRGSSRIDPLSDGVLDQVAMVMAKHPEIKLLRVEGYTDSIGSESANKRLSQRRAESVRRYLIQKGIAPDRVTAVGYGDAHPIASNATAAGRARNRRVEFAIVKKKKPSPQQQKKSPLQQKKPPPQQKPPPLQQKKPPLQQKKPPLQQKKSPPQQQKTE